jgi:hypothetical protein
MVMVAVVAQVLGPGVAAAVTVVAMLSLALSALRSRRGRVYAAGIESGGEGLVSYEGSTDGFMDCGDFGVGDFGGGGGGDC